MQLAIYEFLTEITNDIRWRTQGITLLALAVALCGGAAIAHCAPTANSVAEFDVEANRLQPCVEENLRKDGERPIAVATKNQILITTRFREVTTEELNKIARLRGSVEDWSGGRYRLQFAIRAEGRGRSSLSATAQILANPSAAYRPRFPLMNPARPIEGSFVPSNGELEWRWRDILRKSCG
jgi:hypothetical protein